MVALVLAGGCDRDNDPSSRTSSTARSSGTPLNGSFSEPDLLKLQQDDGQWVMPAKNYASTRYSSLDEINTGNASRLKVAWTFSTGVNAGHEAAPLIVGTTMFLVTPVSQFRLCARSQPARRADEMEVRPQVRRLVARRGLLRRRQSRRRLRRRHRIFFNTLDGRTVAVDAETGQERWITKLGDINHGESMTMAPIVAHGKVIVGNSGGEFGVRGWLTALDAKTGSVAWRAYTTGPDKDVLIGTELQALLPAGPRHGPRVSGAGRPRRGRLAAARCGAGSRTTPSQPRVCGTANPGPWNPDQRPGDNKWTAGIFARDPDTGEARWYYQWSPHDLFDHDGVNENILLDLNLQRRHAQGARASRSQRLHVRARPRVR